MLKGFVPPGRQSIILSNIMWAEGSGMGLWRNTDGLQASRREDSLAGCGGKAPSIWG